MQNVDTEAPGPGRTLDCSGTLVLFIAALQLFWPGLSALSGVPEGCKPPELVISPQHPLVILYGPGTAELTVKCWQHLPADIRPYCAVTMDPASLDLKERLDA